MRKPVLVTLATFLVSTLSLTLFVQVNEVYSQAKDRCGENPQCASIEPPIPDTPLDSDDLPIDDLPNDLCDGDSGAASAGPCGE